MAKELTTKQIAEEYKVAERAVRRWCENGKFPNARKEQTPRGDYWLVPDTDLKGFTAPESGRPKSDNPSKAALAKRAQREREKVTDE